VSGLDEILERVHDERTLLEFMNALSNDFAREREIEKASPPQVRWQGALGWENGTVDAFLEAAAAWGETGVLKDETPNPWRRFADILYAGKIYE
jgi:hypothetical protein